MVEVYLTDDRRSKAQPTQRGHRDVDGEEWPVTRGRIVFGSSGGVNPTHEGSDLFQLGRTDKPAFLSETHRRPQTTVNLAPDRFATVHKTASSVSSNSSRIVRRIWSRSSEERSVNPYKHGPHEL
jgi:hypothetical protein